MDIGVLSQLVVKLLTAPRHTLILSRIRLRAPRVHSLSSMEKRGAPAGKSKTKLTSVARVNCRFGDLKQWHHHTEAQW